jgi:hypothetical protein
LAEGQALVDVKDFKEISPKASTGFGPAHIYAGLPIPKTTRIRQFSPEEWADFLEEWASSLKDRYASVLQFSGAGDKGIDIAGFLKGTTFDGGWDNYQCKHYSHALRPSDVWIEIGKVVFYSFNQEYPPPGSYFFVAPRGTGTTLSRLLSQPERLRAEFFENWEQYCRDQLTESGPLELTGPLRTYAEKFDFGIFKSLSITKLIQQHAATPFHAVRFGGGLPPRHSTPAPPGEIQAHESRYVQKLYEVYSEDKQHNLVSLDDLKQFADVEEDFWRQRERFYSAEALRNFARDSVPPGTFEAVKEEAFHGVIDTCNATHSSGLTRMRETLNRSTMLSFSASPLFSVISAVDKQGMCHQLANEDRLFWMHRK